MFFFCGGGGVCFFINLPINVHCRYNTFQARLVGWCKV